MRLTSLDVRAPLVYVDIKDSKKAIYDKNRLTPLEGTKKPSLLPAAPLGTTI
jgi:hypothetical protein